MSEGNWSADRFERNRPHLQAVAYRMLGSAAEAHDAVQESWQRLSRSGADGVQNLTRWLTATLGRVCLEKLCAREPRRGRLVPAQPPKPAAISADRADDPEQEALAADSVGLALLLVLDKLSPGERVAFVLHDMFDMPTEYIAAIVGRTPNATRLLTRQARRRVHGARAERLPATDLVQQREVGDAFLAAARGGDSDALIAVLDPQVVLRVDAAAVPVGSPREVRGAHLVARRALAFAAPARFAQRALVNGGIGVVLASCGRLFTVLEFTCRQGKISAIDVIAAPWRLRRLDIAEITDLEEDEWLRRRPA